METNKNTQQDEQNTDENANSSYSSSGSMQPGAGTGEAGRLNNYQKGLPGWGLGQKKQS